jgi:hypothetical protein
MVMISFFHDAASIIYVGSEAVVIREKCFANIMT